ncbi:MAG: glycosyltransferase [Mucilaginibacter sp.]
MRTNALVKYLKAEKIDVVFAEYGMVGAMVAESCKLASIPLIIHFHGADVHHRVTVNQYYDQYQQAFKYASALIAVSCDMALALKQLGAPEDKIINASCGIDTAAFPAIDISGSVRNFLSVGRFVEKKSPISIVNAFKIVADKYPDAKLWMIGQGPLYNETVDLVNTLGLQNHITLTGILTQAQIKQLMQNMRCFVQHSVTAASGDMEGTPVSVLEASSSALPVVSTCHAGIKEAVIDGVTGLLCDEYNIEAMAKNMITIAENIDLAVKMGKAGRQHMIAAYEIKNRITLLDSIIKSSLLKFNPAL